MEAAPTCLCVQRNDHVGADSIILIYFNNAMFFTLCALVGIIKWLLAGSCLLCVATVCVHHFGSYHCEFLYPDLI